jgi:hypothetical protein
MVKPLPWAFAVILIGACSSTSSSPAVPGDGGGGSEGGGGDGGAAGDGSVHPGDDGAATRDGNGGDDGGPVTGSLVDRIATSDVTVPAGVKPGDDNFRIWGQSSLKMAPVYTVPLANCGTLVCFTTGTGDSTSGTSEARVAVLGPDDKLVRALDLGAFECRGLAAEADGHFAALLWQTGAASDCKDVTQNGRIFMKRFDLMGTQSWSTELVNDGPAGGVTPNCPTDWGLGEARMDFGNGTYGAYYHVHSQSGHEGDTLKYVDTSGNATTTWAWGCSHSMSDALRYNAATKAFLPACVTDCYPGTSGSNFATTSQGGLYTKNHNDVIDVDAGCNGSVAGELGGAAPASAGWKLVFNAHQNAMMPGQSSYDKSTMNQDIGFASVAADQTRSGSVVWLTTTASINEADSTIERWQPAGDATEQYVVGWAEPGPSYAYKLSRIDAKGAVLEGPLDVTAKARWGRRDDPLRAHVNGDVVWAWFDAAGATTMHFARLRSGGSVHCASF